MAPVRIRSASARQVDVFPVFDVNYEFTGTWRVIAPECEELVQADDRFDSFADAIHFANLISLGDTVSIHTAG